MRTKLHIYFLGVFLMLIATKSYSQEEWSESGEIQDAQVVVEKDRQIEMPTAIRSFDKVPAQTIDQEITPQQYNFNEYDYSGSGYSPTINPKRLNTRGRQETLSNYVKLGFGNYLSPLGELSLNTSNKKIVAGLLFRHLSFSRGPVDGSNSAASDNDGRIYASLLNKNSVLSANLDFNSLKRYHYGFTVIDPTAEISPTKQVYNTFGLSIGLKNTKPNSDFDYSVSTGYYNLTDNFDARENGFELEIDFDAPLTGEFTFFSETDLLLTNYEDGTDQNRNLIKTKAGAKYPLGNLLISGAANLVYSNDTISNANKFKVYPFASVTYDLTDQWQVQGGINGDLEAVTLRSTSRENPFLAAAQPLVHSNKRIELFGKINGKVSQSLALASGLSFANYENLYFFTDSLRFDLTYDTDATDILNIWGEATFTAQNDFSLRSRLDFYNYNTKSLNEAWHRPTFQSSTFLRYQLNQEVSLGSTLLLIGGVKAFDPVNNQSQTLDTIFDLGLNGEYKINQAFRAFIELNNVLGQKYERFFNYPNRSFMLHLGATYSF